MIQDCYFGPEDTLTLYRLILISDCREAYATLDSLKLKSAVDLLLTLLKHRIELADSTDGLDWIVLQGLWKGELKANAARVN